MQQITEHAERPRREIDAQGQARLALRQAAQRLPETFLGGERHPCVGVAELRFQQAAIGKQRGAVYAQAAGGVQHGLGDAGADRGVLWVERLSWHAPILPKGAARR
ncbi:hypothetical protein FQZ97_955020 [compost metagenome]